MRTIESPGVEIREIDLSFNTQLPYATTVFAVGYASQGPTDELINVTSMDELEQIYGLPTNAAERYFYHTCKQVLTSNGNLLTTRLPYGSGSGDGFTNKYSALVFPVFPYSSDPDDSSYSNSATGDNSMIAWSVAPTASATYAYPYADSETLNGVTSALYNTSIDLYVSGVDMVALSASSVVFKLSGSFFDSQAYGELLRTVTDAVSDVIEIRLDSDSENLTITTSNGSNDFITGTYEHIIDETQDLIRLNLTSKYFFGTTQAYDWSTDTPRASNDVTLSYIATGSTDDGETYTRFYLSAVNVAGLGNAGGFSEMDLLSTWGGDLEVDNTFTFTKSAYSVYSGTSAFSDLAYIEVLMEGIPQNFASGESAFIGWKSNPDMVRYPINCQVEYTYKIKANSAGDNYTHLDNADTYYIGQPYHITLTDSQYLDMESGGINWQNQLTSCMAASAIYDSTSGNLGKAGFIIVNKEKTSIDDLYSGFYVAIMDNSKADKGSNFDSIQYTKTINSSTNAEEWLTLNSNRLNFEMTGDISSNQGSISEIMETLPDFNFAADGIGGYSDCLTLAAFKLRPSIYNTESRLLDDIMYESYVGSLDYSRTVDNPNGGGKTNFSLEKTVNEKSNMMKIFVNPYMGGSDSGMGNRWFDPDTGTPLKKVRVVASERTNTNSSVATDPAQPSAKALTVFNAFSADRYISNGDNLYGIGEYNTCYSRNDKIIGNIPSKLETALRLAENYEQLRIDIVTEGGLGTIWTGTQLDMNNWETGTTNRYNFWQPTQIFDDTVKINGILNAHTFDRDSAGLLDQATGSSAEAQDLWETIFNIFNNFCQFTRKDCLQICDPLRYIFVQGNGEVKVMDDKTKNFSQHIFWPLKNLFGATNTSYACTYANWFKTNDKASDKFIWAPPSGFLARQMVDTDTNFYPWYAPAGLTRGILRDVLDIGINPTRKQRDLLYKININPTVYWPGDGYVVWGQKTLQAKPSAFDRINVRRLFLWLEKAVLPIARYFVFEQNTTYTRSRLKDAIRPIFEFAKDHEGVYDYLIVCDDRNNTPDVIDRNELVVDIYIKPVRVAEFILINFIATRTGQNFEELI